MSIDAFPTDVLADEPSWTLIVADHTGQPIRQISLLELTKLTVGRSTERDLILDDSRISRFHCILYLERGVWCVVDAQSSGGTLVEGQRVLWKRLHEQRAVRIGNLKLWIRQSPLPPIDPALNRPLSAADNAEIDVDPHADPSPSDTMLDGGGWTEDGPLPLDPQAPVSVDAVTETDEEDSALERTSVFLREEDDFVDASPPWPRDGSIESPNDDPRGNANRF